MKFLTVIMGLLAGLLFGLATPISKSLLVSLNSFQLAGLLYLGAALTFMPHFIKSSLKQKQYMRSSAVVKKIGGIIVFGGIIGPLFLLLGLKNANSSSVSIWLNMELVATALLGAFFFREHLGRLGIVGLLLTIGAGVVVSFQETHSGWIAGGFIFLACISWGIDNQLTATIDNVTPQSITFIKGVTGGLINLVIGMIISENRTIDLKILSTALLTGVFAYGISIVLYVTSAQNLGATRSQVLFSTAPFWGILISSLYLGETIGVNVVLAMMLLLIGIVLTHVASHGHEHKHYAAVHMHLHSHGDGHHQHSHEGGEDVNERHFHEHTHSDIWHSHAHYPDLHHRHIHKDVVK
ncbi:MAG: EamA family transporter [Fibrobacteres bacterium]|nr:EamA family transporter [Fibrobacterota bacterium]